MDEDWGEREEEERWGEVEGGEGEEEEREELGELSMRVFEVLYEDIRDSLYFGDRVCFAYSAGFVSVVELRLKEKSWCFFFRCNVREYNI